MCRLLICLLLSHTALSALRDPFLRASKSHLYAYTGYGVIHHTHHMFGIITVDGVPYQVRVGDKVADHEVIALSSLQITLKDPHGELMTLLYKKSPST